MSRIDAVKVSVIIPVYNSINSLRICIESVIKQEVEGIEIILIDDGSTDGSGEICDEYARNYCFICSHHQNNSGSASARNRGIRYATGKYLYFLDSDDWIDEGMLEETYEYASASRADMLFFGYRKEIDSYWGMSVMEFMPPLMQQPSIVSAESFDKLIRSGFGFALWDRLIRRAIVEDNQLIFSDLERGQDLKFSFDLFSVSKIIVTKQKSYYHYIVRRKQLNSDILKRDFMYLYEYYIHIRSRLGETSNYNGPAQLFVLWFAYMLPRNIYSDKGLTLLQKIRSLRDLFHDNRMRAWSEKINYSDFDTVVERILYFTMRNGAPLLMLLVILNRELVRLYPGDYRQLFFKRRG